MRKPDIMLIAIWLEISVVFSQPLLLHPYQRLSMQASQQNLQQQLMDLQMVQQVYPIPRFDLSQPQPFILLVPDQSLIMTQKTNDYIENEIKANNHKTRTKDEDEESDSVVIDAEPIPILEEQKAFLVIPAGRGIIGGFISAIPFLPLEINVPDSISWAYNGISGGISSIISIIGSGLPFLRPNQESQVTNNLKSINNELQMKNNVRPFVVMPLGGLIGPISPFPLRMIKSSVAL